MKPTKENDFYTGPGEHNLVLSSVSAFFVFGCFSRTVSSLFLLFKKLMSSKSPTTIKSLSFLMHLLLLLHAAIHL